MQLLRSAFFVWVVLGAVWGALFPEQAGAGRAWIGEALMLIMLGMGLTIRSEDLLALRSAGRPLLLGVSLQYLVMPLLAWSLAWLLGLPEMLALGVILVGCAPGGTASNVVTWLARGDVALSVAMTTASTLLAPIMTPLWIWILASTWLAIEPGALFISIVKIVLLPVAVGILIRRFWQPSPMLLDGLFPLLAMLAIAWIVGVVVGLNMARIDEVALPLLSAIVLLNGLGLFAGYQLTKRAGQSVQRRRTVAIEVGMQNSGLAAALAMAHFSAEAALAAALFSLWHNLSGAALSAYWQRSSDD